MHGMALECLRSHSCNSVFVNKCISYPSKYTSQQQNYTIIPSARESWCRSVCSSLFQIIFKGDDQPAEGCRKDHPFLSGYHKAFLHLSAGSTMIILSEQGSVFHNPAMLLTMSPVLMFFLPALLSRGKCRVKKPQ